MRKLVLVLLILCTSSIVAEAATFTPLAHLKRGPAQWDEYRGSIISGSRVYACTRDSGELLVFEVGDLSGATNFTGERFPVFTLSLGFEATSLVQRGRYLYIGGGDVAVVDLIDPARPSLVFTLGIDSSCYLKVSGGKLVAMGWYGLTVFGLSNPRNPAFEAWCAYSDRGFDAAISGDFLFVGEWGAMNGILCYRRSGEGFTKIGHVPLYDMTPYHLEIVNGKLVMLGENYEKRRSVIATYSIAYAASPQKLDSLPINNARGFGFSNGTILTHRDIVDAKNPSRLTSLGNMLIHSAISGFPYNISIKGSLASLSGSDHVTIGRFETVSVKPAGHKVNGAATGWNYPLGSLYGEGGKCYLPTSAVSFGFMSYNQAAYPYHYAQDLTGIGRLNLRYREGDPVYAMSWGKIIRVRNSGSYGGNSYNTMLVQYDFTGEDGNSRPVYVLYGHVKNVKEVVPRAVARTTETIVDIPVAPFEKIAELNDPGAQWKHVFHLHFAVMPDKIPSDWYGGYAPSQKPNGRARPFDCWSNSNGTYSRDWVVKGGSQDPAKRDVAFFDTYWPG